MRLVAGQTRNARAANAFAALILIGCRDVKQLRLVNENLRIPQDTISMPKLAQVCACSFCSSCRVGEWKISFFTNINILQDSEFVSANKIFEEKAKLFTKENNAKPRHKSSIQSGNMQKFNRYNMEGQNKDSVWKDAEKLVEFIWFSLCFHFARRGREGWRELTRQSFEIKTDDTGARYVTKKLTEQTKNY